MLFSLRTLASDLHAYARRVSVHDPERTIILDPYIPLLDCLIQFHLISSEEVGCHRVQLSPSETGVVSVYKFKEFYKKQPTSAQCNHMCL